MTKTTMWIGAVLGVLALLWAVSSLPVNAQSPINDDPVRALYMYDRPYFAPANTWVWFKFDHNGDRTKPVEIILLNGRERGLDFRVYTPEQIQRITDDKFVGRGNVIQVPCVEGKCESQHLFWRGTFNLAGTYYVAVMNPKNFTIGFRLLISGESVSLGNEPPPLEALATPTPPDARALPTTTPPFSSPSSITGTAALPTTTPPVIAGLATLTPLAPGAPAQPVLPPLPVATATPMPPQNNSPYFAIYVPDNRPQAILANGELWYKFDYTGDRSKITLVLPNGNAWGFDFKLYTTEQAFRVYDEDKFVGRGSAVNQACDTGKCTADDLTWIGSFNTAGTYFVRVINTKPLPQTFVLQIAGTAVNIIGP